MHTRVPPSAEMMKPGDDGGENAGFRLDARGDGKSHRQRQRHDADGEAGDEVGGEIVAGVILERVEEFRSKWNSDVHIGTVFGCFSSPFYWVMAFFVSVVELIRNLTC